MNCQKHLFRFKGFTLVELLVVMAIVGVLISLILPAVQTVREAARKTHCTNSLKQISLGILTHEHSKGHFPYGGWGHEWVGVPGRGSKKRQPGGWIYNTLPYLEQTTLHQLGGDPGGVNANALYSRRLETPLCIFTCPSRRPCSGWAVCSQEEYLSRPKPSGHVTSVARGDYAINAGATLVFSWPGPDNLELGDNPNTDWPNAESCNGISHLRYGATFRQISDGTSFTYLVGEKFLNPDHYFDGQSRGDNETLYSGYATDLHRFTRIDLLPLQDTPTKVSPRGYLRFGSAHPSGFLISLCDGSVQLVSFDISPAIHFQLGHRSDGRITEIDQL